MNLPDEILLIIFSQPCLTATDKCVFLDVCQQWKRVVGDASLWQQTYVTEKQAMALRFAWPLDMPIWLHVRERPSPRLARLCPRIVRMKWQIPESMSIFHRNLCHLTHLQVDTCQETDMARVLANLSALRVLFLENIYSHPRTSLSLAKALENLAFLTHLRLGNDRMWEDLAFLRCFSKLVYLHMNDLSSIAADALFNEEWTYVAFETHEDGSRHAVRKTEHSRVRYVYIANPLSIVRFRRWTHALEQQRYLHFYLCFERPSKVNFRPLDVPRVLSWYPEATFDVQDPLYCFDSGKRFTFDTIDDAI